MQWNEVNDYFIKHDLLPSSTPEVSDYHNLEKEFLRHIFSSGEKPDKVVTFDSECIDNADSYSDLFNKFISCMSGDMDIELLNSQVELENQSAKISVKKQNKIIETRWSQAGDWVSEEFLQYVLDITSDQSEVFHSFDPGDQTIVYVCIDKEIEDFLSQSKDDIESAGSIYFQQQFENKSADGFSYLPRRKYMDVINEFKDSFMSSDLFEISSFKPNAIDVICGLFIPTLVHENLSKARTKYASPDLCLYTEESIWDLDAIVPDSNAYVFTKDAKLAVLFEANAKVAMSLLGSWASDDPKPDLIFMAKDSSWAIVARPFEDLKYYLVFIGFGSEEIEQNELVFNAEK